jgi:hypothetical protein
MGTYRRHDDVYTAEQFTQEVTSEQWPRGVYYNKDADVFEIVLVKNPLSSMPLLVRALVREGDWIFFTPHGPYAIMREKEFRQLYYEVIG